ncbi:MAG: gliding motility-associated ABC transporter substrate-binding protein GldG [Bacteroidales bacterium]|jgi:ABC-2 type transport system permease protein|nr:gliding motility-associated ABC transporter substrate-binding protein GldG [Bacteroidales bacterium]
MKKKTSYKPYKYFSSFVIVLIAIIVVNLISSRVFTRFDLTTEKRYTLSPATKDLLRNLDDIVYFRVYLEGDFPAGFKRLRRATKELLDDFRAYNKNIQYEFINPSQSENVDERNATYQLLVEQGLNPTNLQVKTKTGMDQQVIFPGAIATYRNKELPIELLNAQMNVPPEAVLNNSIQNLEFKFANIINKLIKKVKPKVAFIEGHGELNLDETYDITLALQEDYIVERFRLDSNINALVNRALIDSATSEYQLQPKYEAIIIAKPDSVFSSKDKFIIDQYIMHGGKVLWLIDPVLTSMDSIQSSESTVAIENPLDLKDQLFTYGIKLNTDLVMDMNAMPIPIRTGQMGNQPQIDFFPWYYFPLVTPTSTHPVVRNLNTIKTQFVSSLDTSRVRNVKKTVLLKSSPYTRVVGVPAMISLSLIRQQTDESLYQGPPRPVAVLMEGVFESHYKNRVPPSLMEAKEIGFKDFSERTAMIVVSDGDVIKNQFHIPNGYPLPLGYDQFTRETFGNKEFILNAINYLTDGPGLISIRSRELKLRLLDKTKITNNRTVWQITNVLAPVLVVLIVGMLLIWLRKRKYAR